MDQKALREACKDQDRYERPRILLNRGRDIIDELKVAGVDELSVSLNAHNRETYSHVCRPRFNDAYEGVQGFIEKARGEFDAEVTAVAIPEVDVERVREIAHDMGWSSELESTYRASSDSVTTKAFSLFLWKVI